MNKRMRNLVSISCLVGSMFLAGCGKDTEEEDVPPEDKSKVQITIATYQGGLGSQWIDDICNDLKTELADYTDSTFKEGEKGVRFKVLMNTSYQGTKLTSGLSNSVDMYFTESVDYSDLSRKGYLLDITDAVKDPLTDVGDTGTIEEKLDPNMSAFLTYRDQKYYALPFYDGFYHMIYDVDLFDENRWFKSEDGKWVGLSGNLHAGADGVKGTFDDGLPRTFAEFNELVSKMSDVCRGVGYAGNDAKVYITRYLQNIWATSDGYDQAMLNYNFNGKATTLVDVNDDGSTTKKDDLDLASFSDGYKLAKQKGKYDALRFCKDSLLAQGTISPSVNTWNHLSAQDYFINTKYSSYPEENRFGILIDGSWWQNEASAIFNADLVNHPDNGGAKKRRFGILPAPRVDNSHLNTPEVLINGNQSYAFINKNTEHPELMKKILRYFHTEKYLSRFTGSVGMTRPFTYDVSSSDLDNCSYYTKQLLDLKKRSKIIYPLSTIQEFNDKPSYFSQDAYPFSIARNSSDVLTTLSGNSQNNTPKAYFDAMAKYAESSWNA